jgi:hypothetical protein
VLSCYCLPECHEAGGTQYERDLPLGRCGGKEERWEERAVGRKLEFNMIT